MFNTSLLAKKWWRLIHGDNLLSSRILSAKYFTKGSLSSASRVNRDSFIWASLLVGKIVIDEVSLCKVGDGIIIDIWRSKWLSEPHTFKVTPFDETPTHVLVAYLIDVETHSCKSDILQTLFIEPNHNLIEDIHISWNVKSYSHV